MYRCVSWMAIGIAAAFLVFATAAFWPAVTTWLAFGIGLGALIVSGSVSLGYRSHIATLLTRITAGAASAWTVVASAVFSDTTVQSLALASGAALAGSRSSASPGTSS